jgi:hypothetical protein
MKFNWILWRRPRPKLGCGAKERRRSKYTVVDNVQPLNNSKLWYTEIQCVSE